jgi:GntR family transcriptional regulator, transcriptional repressor for pyruvate dehydrogenase complex
MTIVFKPIRPKKISEEIVEQIKALISKGQLKPGERIPSERDLAALLGVSRPSVREAIMVLEAMGLLESRQGGGTYVRSLTESVLADPLTTMVEKDPLLLQALVEVRMGIESWAAFLAASRATQEEIDTLAKLLKEMERQAARGGWDPKVDAQFHYTITTATHNTLQLHVLDTIRGLFHATIELALTEFYRREGYLEALLAQHRSIYEAISDRNPEQARQSMMDHLQFVQEKMPQILQEREAERNSTQRSK